MHGADVQLTDEPLGELPPRISRFFQERGLDPARLWILDIVRDARGI